MPIPPGTLEAFGLFLIRTGALVTSAPVLGYGSGFSGYKVGLTFLLAFLLYAASGEPLPADALHPIGYGLLAAREVVIGVFLGFFLHLVLLAVRVTGEMIGHEMGFMVASQVDPASGIHTPLITSVYENLFLLALLTMNGHHWLVRSLGESFHRAPVGRLSLGAGVVPAVRTMFGEMFGAGIVFAAPVMVFLMLVSILIGLLARAVPQLNVLEVGFTLRVAIALVAMFLFAPLLEPAMTRLYEGLVLWLDRGLAALEA
ncbi:MAG: flagellar biosynthetic protein FliR [Planctomycetota bacterium]